MIVNFDSESELEEFLLDNPEYLYDMVGGAGGVRSQIDISPYGVMDLMHYAVDENLNQTLTIIEIKNRRLEAKDYFQLKRYMKGVSRYLEDVGVPKIKGILLTSFECSLPDNLFVAVCQDDSVECFAMYVDGSLQLNRVNLIEEYDYYDLALSSNHLDRLKELVGGYFNEQSRRSVSGNIGTTEGDKREHKEATKGSDNN